MIKKVIGSALLILLVLPFAFAQSTTSGITGRVYDANKEILPGVLITATHQPSGTVYRAVSNAKGYYSIVGMRPGGPYEVESKYMGYKPTKLEDIRLSLGETSVFNIQMNEDNQLLTEVVVMADKTSVFNSRRTGAATNFTRDKIAYTPTISRSIFDVAKLTPQAVSAGSGTSFAGTSNKFNSFQIDGTVNNDVFGLSKSGTNGGQAGAAPISLDAIEELQVVIAPFDVRQGGFTGGGINAITKSGTNSFHGSAYGYYNNQNFVGSTPGKDIKDREKLTEQSSKTYGFTFGGPILKNKLFFFSNLELVDERYPSSYNVGSGSEISKEDADRVVEHLKKIHNGDNGGGYGPRDIDTKSIKFLTRLDWNINDNNKLTFRYNFVKGKRLNFGNQPKKLRLNNNAYYMNNKTHSLVTELNSKLTQSLSNVLRFGYTRVRDFRELLGTPFPYVKIFLDGDRSIELGSEKYSAANYLNQDIYTLTDNVSWFKGAHTFTFGTHNEFFKITNLFIRDNYGAYEYSNIDDFLTIGTANPAAPKQYEYSFSDVNGNRRWAPTFGAAQLGFYAQDEWRVSDLLNITYGVRIDIPLFLDKPTVNDKFNNGTLAKEYSVATHQMPKVNPLYSPRLGFRWFANEERATLLRGGIGIFSGRVPFVWVSNSFSNTGVEYNRTRLRSRDFNDAIADGFKFEVDPDKQYKPSNVFKSEIDVLDKNFRYPQILRTNLALEQRLPYDVKFTLEGIYTKTLNNILYKNLANEKIGQLDNGTGDRRFLYRQREDSKNFNNVIWLGNTNEGYTYNITAKLEKDFKCGLSTMLAYTYGDSKGINDGASSQAYSGWKYNEVYNGDDKPELTTTDFNIRHRIIGNLSYHKEYGKHFATTVSLFYNGQSGSNYSVTYRGDINGDGYYGNDLLYVPTAEEIKVMNFAPTKELSANEQREKLDAWISATPEINKYRGTYIPRNALTVPFHHHFDLHLSQDFYVNVSGRRNTLQLNLDILNLGNMLNRGWGLVYTAGYGISPIDIKRGSAVGSPEYQFTPPKGDKLYYVADFPSRWKAQIGLRYIF